MHSIHSTLGNNWEVRTKCGNFSELEIGMNRQFPPKYSYSFTRQGSSDLGKTEHAEMTCTSLAQYKKKSKRNRIVENHHKYWPSS